MSTAFRAAALLLATAAAAFALPGCIATDGGGYYDGGGAYYTGAYYPGAYYEPYPYGYGGWGRSYHVGPARGGARGHDGGNHAYRSAPGGRTSPSLPGHSRRR